MPNLLKYVLVAAAIAVPSLAHADGTLVGTSVTGHYYPMGSSPGAFNTSVNYFDPTNGLVPAGYGNSSSATATITDPGIEFAAVDGGGIVTNPGVTGYTAEFTGSTVTLTQYNNYPFNLAGFEEIFTDPAFVGLTVTKTSDNFANGPMTATLVGDTLTISIAPNCLIGSGCSGWGRVGVASWSLTKPTPPVIAIGNPSNNAGFPVGSNVNAIYTCADALSGAAAASCVGTLPSGTALDTTTAGTQNFSVTATDAAGNTATTNTSYLISTLTLTTPGSIWTIAGDGIRLSQEDSGPAINAPLYTPYGVATDSAGNVYIADVSSQRIRKMSPDGSISTVAGNGVVGSGGDGQLATSAGLNNPFGVAVDGNGNIYIADSGNNRIRKVTPDGTISTVAGGGSSGLGDGGPATDAILSQPFGIALDSANNLYIAETSGNRIRKVAADGTISTVAGNGTLGYSGDGGPATGAELASPIGVAVDRSGNLYIADINNNRIREVTGTTISTVAGTGAVGFTGDGQVATAASLYFPTGVAIDGAGNLYIADAGNNRVRVVSSADGVISTVAGSEGIGFAGDGGMATGASLQNPNGVALDSSGNLYIADYNNQRIRLVAGIGQSNSTPPSITSNLSGTLGNSGWYTSNVSVTWTVTDPLAPIISQTGCDTTVIGVDTAGQTVTCTAVGQGGTTTKSVTVKRDATAPTATATPAPLPNGYGWNNSVVTVTFSGTDALSGIASCSTPVVVVAEGANQDSPTGTCTDNAGNVGAPVSVSGINIDRTVPLASAAATPIANAAGWNNTPVTVNFTATDSLSGVTAAACTPATVVVSAQGAGLSASASCADRAGNVASATLGGLRIDTQPPVAVATLTPAPNAAGWNNSNVTVAFTGTDALSGSGVASCSGTVAVTTEVSGQVLSGTCADVAGNVSAGATKTVNVDKTPPTLNITVPASGGTYVSGSTVSAVYGCADTRSGVASCSGPVASGAAIDTSGTGGKSFTVVSADVAGNSALASAVYTVVAGGPAYMLSPAALAFGSVPLGISSSLTLVLSSTGTAALPLTRISLGGVNPGQFSLNNSCGTSVAAGTSCQIVVTLRATSAGAKSATLTVTAGGGAGNTSVALSGTGVAAAYTVSNTSLAFGSVAVGVESAPQVVTVTNTGTVPLPMTPTVTASYVLITTSCASPLPVAGTCVVGAAFNPGATGNRPGTLNINAGGGAVAHPVALTGSGYEPFALSPGSLSFAGQGVGIPSTAQVVTVSNSGPVPLAVTNVSIGGANAARFSQTNTCGMPVAAMGSCTISVVFRPTTAGAATATLSVSGGGGPVAQTVALAGSGIVPTYALGYSTLDFGSLTRGSGITYPITLTNTSTLQLPITGVTIAGTNPGQFSQSNTCGTTLGSGSACTVSVTFSPTTRGQKTATLRMAFGGGAVSPGLVVLSGVGL